jgi:hypothetical protein
MKHKILMAASLATLGLASLPATAFHLPSFSFTEQPFTFDATAYGGGSFTATFIDFSYQAESDQFADSSFDETGMGFFGTFRDTLGGPPEVGTGLGTAYQLYGVFSGAGTIALGGGGIVGTFDTFTFTMYIDPGMNTTASTVTAGGADESKFATGTTGDDVAILTATILVGGPGGSGGFHVFPGLAAGDFDVLMLVTSYDASVWGGLAFSGDTVLADLNGVNTSIVGAALPGTAATDTLINGSGNFSAQSIPVPGVLGLLGAGLLGLGWVNWRSRKNENA